MAKVLIIGPSWVGDMVMAQALAKRLERRADAPEIHMLGPPWALPLACRMPEIAQAHALDVPHGALGLRARWVLGRRLAALGFDEAIILPRSIKAALIPLFAHIPVRRGLIGEWRLGFVNDVVPLRAKAGRTVDEFVALAGFGYEPMRSEERPCLRADPDEGAKIAARHEIPPDARIAVLCPGAEYGPAKRWPEVAFAELARRLSAIGFKVLLVGSVKDRDIAVKIVACAPNAVHDLTGRTTLDEAVDLLAVADVVVTNDSGLMHVAAALDRPTIALFGSSSPIRTPPLSDRAVVVITDEALECRPCFARECRFGHTRCLTAIAPERVAALALAHADSASARSTATST